MSGGRGIRRPGGSALLVSLPAAALALAPAARAQSVGQDPPAAAPARAPVVVVRHVGPGTAGRVLRSTLAAPHVVRHAAAGDTTRLRRDSTVASSLVVIGGTTLVDGTVHGDVVVVGGDLHVRPGATIDGRAVAYGGGVYRSTLATVRGGQLTFRDETFDVAVAAGGAGDTLDLRYRALAGGPPSAITFPAYGFRIPAYDRVEGLSLPFGPEVDLDSGRVVLEPLVTYRSHLGALDVSGRASWALGRRGELTLLAGRGTRTNEGWNRSDLVNSVTALGAGIDARNYYRADLVEARASRRWEAASGDVTPFVGALVERAWSVGPDSSSPSAPFSFLERRDRVRGMLRPNPRVARGRITSALAGLTARWGSQGVITSFGAALELPARAVGDLRFVQATLDGTVGFPTFGSQRLDVLAHSVLTAGDTAPPQRFAYLGGEDGTIVTRHLLELGGDQLLYLEGLYSIPIQRLRLGVLGSPVVSLRYAAGSAGVGRLPALDQNVGARLQLSFARVYYAIDPATHESRTGFSLSIFR
ncbi:MAG: hypothetical protein ACJ79S_05405 [Gemmatimonadaceae bacterium]